MLLTEHRSAYVEQNIISKAVKFSQYIDILYLELKLIAPHVQNVFTVIVEQREQLPFSVAIENGKLMHECYSEHFGMETARLK